VAGFHRLSLRLSVWDIFWITASDSPHPFFSYFFIHCASLKSLSQQMDLTAWDQQIPVMMNQEREKP